MKVKGRPRKPASGCVCGQQAEEIIADITFCLDKVLSWLYDPAMFQGTIEEAMLSRLRHEVQKVQELEVKLRELASQYNEFLDTQKEAKERKKRIELLVGIIGEHDWTAHIGKDFANRGLKGLQIDEAKMRGQLILWEAMREYLSYVPEARIDEMEAFFRSFGYGEGNRQAMESALKRHPDVFKTRKQKREKYISLKK